MDTTTTTAAIVGRRKRQSPGLTGGCDPGGSSFRFRLGGGGGGGGSGGPGQSKTALVPFGSACSWQTHRLSAGRWAQIAPASANALSPVNSSRPSRNTLAMFIGSAATDCGEKPYSRSLGGGTGHAVRACRSTWTSIWEVSRGVKSTPSASPRAIKAARMTNRPGRPCTVAAPIAKPVNASPLRRHLSDATHHRLVIKLVWIVRPTLDGHVVIELIQQLAVEPRCTPTPKRAVSGGLRRVEEGNVNLHHKTYRAYCGTNTLQLTV